MIILDYQDRRPIYEQITEKFRTLIYQGALPAGSRLPSVRQLAMELSINPNTIQRAYMHWFTRGTGWRSAAAAKPMPEKLQNIWRTGMKWRCFFKRKIRF